jgi:serine/alanine racemase
LPESSTYKGLDLFKLVMAFFIVAIHSGLFTDLDGELAFVTIQVFARMGVPFFFIASGFFFSKGLAKRRSEAPAYLGRYEKKLLGLFAFWSLVMLAFWVRNGLRAHGFGWEFALRLAQTIAFDPGVFWYLLALVVSSLFAYPFIRRGKGALLFAIACLFYVFGCFGDSYYGLVKDAPVLGDLYRAYFSIFVHARHGLPFGLFFFSLGHLFARDEGKLALRKLPLLAVFALSLALRYLELRFLRERGWALDNSISLFAALPAVLLFLLAYNLEPRIGDEASRGLRTLSSTIFFSHQLMLELVILFVELSRIQVTASLRFLVASLLCVLLFLAVRAGRSEFLKRMING